VRLAATATRVVVRTSSAGTRELAPILAPITQISELTGESLDSLPAVQFTAFDYLRDRCYLLRSTVNYYSSTEEESQPTLR
jgi:hypothetical protein